MLSTGNLREQHDSFSIATIEAGHLRLRVNALETELALAVDPLKDRYALTFCVSYTTQHEHFCMLFTDSGVSYIAFSLQLLHNITLCTYAFNGEFHKVWIGFSYSHSPILQCIGILPLTLC